MDVTTIGVGVDSSGVKQATSDLDAMAASGKNVEASVTKLESAVKSQSATTKLSAEASATLAAEQAKLGTQVDKLFSSQDKAYKAMLDYAKGQDVLSSALSKGVIDHQTYTGAMGTLQKTLDAASESTNTFGVSAGFASQKIGVMMHELASGRDRQFLTTMSILVQKLAEANPAFIATGLAIAALGGYLVYSAYQVEKLHQTFNALQAQFTATGRAGMETNQQLYEMVRALESLHGISRASAEKIIAPFAAAKNITKDMLETAIKLVPDFAAALGVDAVKAAKDMADSLEKPYEGLKKLDEQFGWLTTTQYLSLEAMHKVGDVLGEQKLLLDVTAEHASGLAKGAMTEWQTSINNIAKEWDKTKSSLLSDSAFTTLGKYLETATTSSLSFGRSLQELPSWIKAVTAALLPMTLPIAEISILLNSMSSKVAAPTNSVTGRIVGINSNVQEQADTDALLKKQLELTAAYRNQDDAIASLKLRRNALTDAFLAANAQGAISADIANAYNSSVAGIDKAIEKLTPKIKENTEYARLLDQANKLVALSFAEMQAGTEKLTNAEKALIQIRETKAWESLTTAQRIQIRQLFELAAGYETVIADAKTAADITRALSKETSFLNDTIQKYQNLIDDGKSKIQEQIDNLGKTSTEIAKQNEFRKLDIQLRKDQDALIKAGPFNPSYFQTLSDINQAGKDAIGILYDQADALKQQQGLWGTVADKAGSFFGDLVVNGSSAIDKLKKEFKTLFADIIAFFAKQYVLSIVAGASGTFGATAAQAAGNALGSMGTSLIGTGLSTAGTYLFGTGATALGASGATIGAGVGSGMMLGGAAGEGAILAGTSGAVGAGGVAASITTALAAIPVWGWIAIAAMAAYAAFGGKGGGPKVSGTGITDVGSDGSISNGPMSDIRRFYSADNKSLDSVFQKMTDSISQSFSELLKKFGGSGVATFTQSGDSDPQGTAQNRIATQAFVNGLKVFEQKNENLKRDGSQNSAEMQIQAERALIAALQASNLPGDMGALFAGIVTATMSQSDYDALIAKATDLQSVLDFIGTNSLPGFTLATVKAMQVTGETLAQTTQRVATQWDTLNNVFKTSDQSLAETEKAMNKAFASIGVSVPANVAEFQKLIGSIDLSTQSGRTLFQTLSLVAPAFKAVSDAAAAATATLDQAIGARNTDYARQTTLASRNDIAQQFADAIGSNFGEELLSRMALSPESFTGLTTAAKNLLAQFLGLQTTIEGYDTKLNVVTRVAPGATTPATTGLIGPQPGQMWDGTQWVSGGQRGGITPATPTTGPAGAPNMQAQYQLMQQVIQLGGAVVGETATSVTQKLRDLTLASTAPELQDLTTKLWQLQDAAAAAAKSLAQENAVLSLQSQILAAGGTVAGQTADSVLAAQRRNQTGVLNTQDPSGALANLTAQLWALQDASTAARNAATLLNSSLSLQSQIAALTGDKEQQAAILQQQRSIALAALDPSLRALQDTLYGLQDASAATAQAAAAAAAAQTLLNSKLSLQSQIAALTGDKQAQASILGQQQQIALAALDPSLRALQTQLWGLQAASSAAAAALALANQRSALQGTLTDLLMPGPGVLARQQAVALAAITDDVSRAIQAEIFAQQNMATAAKKATDAMTVLVGQMDQLSTLKDSVGASIQSIRQDAKGYDLAGYLAGQVASAQTKLAAADSGTVAERIKAATTLQGAIVAQYNEEKNALNAKVAAEQASYNAGIQAANANIAVQNQAIAAANALSVAYKGIGDYAVSLLTGALSPLGAQQKLGLQTLDYRTTIAAAGGGDLTAAGNVKTVSDAMLQNAQSQSKTLIDYALVFAGVQSDLKGLASKAGPTIATLQQVTADGFQISAGLQAKINQSQLDAIAKLDAIQVRVDAWQKDLQDQLSAQALTFTRIGLNTTQIAASTTGLDSRIAKAITAATAAQTDANTALATAMQGVQTVTQQSAANAKKTADILAQITQGQSYILTKAAP